MTLGIDDLVEQPHPFRILDPPGRQCLFGVLALVGRFAVVRHHGDAVLACGTEDEGAEALHARRRLPGLLRVGGKRRRENAKSEDEAERSKPHVGSAR